MSPAGHIYQSTHKLTQTNCEIADFRSSPVLSL